MATTYTDNGGGAPNGSKLDFTYTFPILQTEDIEVQLNGYTQATTKYTVDTSSNPTKITFNNTSVDSSYQESTGAPKTGVLVTVARLTTVGKTSGDDDPKAVFAAGSSIRASDLNANTEQALYALHELQERKITTTKILDNTVTSDKILDGTIVDADISSSAAIANTKIANGLLNSNLTVNSDNIVDGSIVNADVNNSAAIAGTKISPNFGSQVVQTTGNIVVGGTVDGRDIATDGTKLDGIEAGSTGDQTNAEIKTAYEANANTNEFSDAEQTKLAGIETSATQDQTAAEIKTLLQSDKLTDSEITAGTLDNRYYTETELDAGQLDNRYYTEAELNGGQLNTLYFTESEITGGAADGRYYTETELDAGQLDNRYFTETELTGGALDGRYYTETEAEAKFLRQDSSETIASGATWSNSDAFVATTAAINARIIDLVDEVGGFTVIATELVFPNTNPQGATGQAAILSIGALTQGYTRSGTTVTIANGTVGNSTVTITGVPLDLPTGFGLLVESTSTLNTYTFHRLVPKATEVSTVATNITNIVAAGANLADINNFADLYQISNSAPTQRVDGASLQDGDLWFDNSNGNLRVWDGSVWAIISPNQSVLNDIAIVSGAITYQEDLGLISDSVTTGSSNGSLEIVADALEDEATFTVTASGGAYLIDGVSKPALTLYKGWTYTFDLSSNTLGSHPLRFSSGGSLYSTNVTVTGTQGQAGAKVSIKIPESQPTSFAYYCTNHSGMGNTITVKDDPIKTVSDSITNINAVAGNSTNINAVANNNSNITAVAGNASNINAVQSNATNINAVAGNATNINAVAADASDIGAVAGKATEIGRLGTADAIADMNALGTSAIVSDMDTLADISSNITTVAGISANVTTVANNNSNVSTVAGISSNVTTVAGNTSNINSAVSNASNINTVAGGISNVNTVAGSISNVNTAASNLTNINNFTNRYRIASSAPTSNNDAGDLYFDTASNELRVYNGSAWQGGVTATGNLAGTGANTFSGNQTVNANIIVTGTVDGRDVAADGTKLDGIESGATADQSNSEIKTAYEANSNTNAFTDALLSKLNGIEAGATADQTVAQIVAAIAGQTIAPNVITTTNLTLDFGTL